MQFHPPGAGDRNEIVEDQIRHMLVKGPMVTIPLQVELQGLQLHADPIGDIGDREGPEIGLARLGADRGELRTDRLDLVISIGELIGEGLQRLSKTLCPVSR